MKQLEVKATNDKLEKIANNISTVSAIEELVWNALDADAKNIEIRILENSGGALDKIIVEDNGEGMTYEEAVHAFGSHGASKKQNKPKTSQGRLYHGKNGEGRYKAFRLGKNIKWTSTYRNNGDLLTFDTNIYAVTRACPNIDDTPKEVDGETGVKVTIEDIDGCANLLKPESRDELTIKLASYLLGYENISIIYDGRLINPKSNLAKTELLPISVTIDELQHDAELLICQWNKGSGRTLYLCNEDGIVLHEVKTSICPDYCYSAYLKSNRFTELDSNDQLSIHECFKEVEELKKLAFDEIKKFFKQQTEEKAAELVSELKKQNIYPYKDQPKNLIEETEQKVFDICAVKIHEYMPEFVKTGNKQKEFTLTLIKHALETEPSSIKNILQKILELNDEERDELAQILEYTTFPALIKTAKCIADRLHFLNGLEQVVNDREFKKHLKERAHLQKIIELEYWIFGEKYHFMSPKGGDISLANVLKAHLKILGREELTPEVDAKKLSDIPDICLYQQYCLGQPDEYENLVIELKRPGNLTEDNLSQIKKYANAVADDPLFDQEKTKWTFYLINTDFNKGVKSEANQKDRPRGLVHNPDGGNVKVWCKTWGEIIQECKGRIEFVRGQMDISLQNNQVGIDYLRKKYSEYLPEEITGE